MLGYYQIEYEGGDAEELDEDELKQAILTERKWREAWGKRRQRYQQKKSKQKKPLCHQPPVNVDTGNSNQFIQKKELYMAGRGDCNPWRPSFPGDHGLIAANWLQNDGRPGEIEKGIFRAKNGKVTKCILVSLICRFFSPKSYPSSGRIYCFVRER